MAIIIAPETVGPMLGVPGRFHNRIADGTDSPVWRNQRWTSERRPIAGYGKGAYIQVEARFDDSCSNRSDTFAITATIAISGRRDCEACGYLHDDIAKAFPELRPLIRWHLTSTDGPLHYIANAVYHAGDRDHSGRAAGDVASSETMVAFGDVPALHRVKPAFLPFLREVATYDADGQSAALVPIAVAYVPSKGERAYSTTFRPKYQFAGQPPLAWYQCPFDTEAEAEAFAASFAHGVRFVDVATSYSDGKPRDLDAARAVAIWPEATDAELSVPRAELTAALTARAPALIAAFKSDMVESGFYWKPADAPQAA